MFIGGMVAIPVVYGIVLPTLMELLISDLGLVSGLQSSMASFKKTYMHDFSSHKPPLCPKNSLDSPAMFDFQQVYRKLPAWRRTQRWLQVLAKIPRHGSSFLQSNHVKIGYPPPFTCLVRRFCCHEFNKPTSLPMVGPNHLT